MKILRLPQAIVAVAISIAVAFALLDSCSITERYLYQADATKCIGCRKCLSVCPQNAISWVNGVAVIDKQKCVGCARCLRVCPASAIYPIPDEHKEK
jgi:Fe-S-cluster-containing hydrogenase component 2